MSLLFGQAIVGALALLALGNATGSRATAGDVRIGLAGATLRDLHLERGGAPLFDAQRLDVTYSVRDLLPGSRHRYGLTALTLERPRLWVIRSLDGSFNIAGISGPVGQPAAPAPPVAGPPLDLNATVHGGEVVLRDRSRRKPAPDARFEAIDILATLRGADVPSHYTASGRLAGAPKPIGLTGTIDPARGYALQRLQARSLPLAGVLEVLAGSDTVKFLSGALQDLDVEAYALGDDVAGAKYSIAGGAELAGGALTIPGLIAPIRALGGRLDVSDAGLVTPRLGGQLAGIPLEIEGGLTNLAAPALRLSVVGSGPVERLRRAFAFAKDLPVRGAVKVVALVEGALASPLIYARFDAPAAGFATMDLSAVSGAVGYYDSAVALVPVRARYGRIEAVSRAIIDVGDHTKTQAALTLSGPADALPYAAELAPGADVRVAALIGGTDAALAIRGVLTGSGAASQIAGLGSVDARGDGLVGPISVERAGGSMIGAFRLDRSHSQSAFWIDARNVDLAPVGHEPALAGVALPALPQLTGKFDARLAGAGSPADFALAGRATAHNAIIGGVRVTRAEAAAGGTLAQLGLGAIQAAGPWGTFAGTGGISGEQIALQGDFRGTFDGLETFTGPLDAHGGIVGPIALLIDPHRTVIQARAARTPDARIRGVPIDRIDGTLALEGPGVQVYSASAAVAGGTMAAAGRLGGAGRLGVTARDVDAVQLRLAGAPLSAGIISGAGRASLGGDGPAFDGAAVLAGGRYQRFAVAGDGTIRARGTTIQLNESGARFAGNFGRLDGRLEGVGTPLARYDMQVDVPAGAIGPLARLVAPTRRDIAGSFTGALHLGGTPAAPELSGAVRVSEGTVNGQRYRNGAAQISADPSGIAARAGTVVVGSTQAGFAGTYRGQTAAFAIDAPRANLADFNDLFDPGDLLGGQGRVKIDFRRTLAGVQTRADTSITGVQYRRIPLGDVSARWSSTGSRVDGQANFTGPGGQLSAEGSITFPGRVPLQKLIASSTYDMRATLRGFDLNTWLPVLGYDLPLGGRVDANATMRGRFPALAVSTEARLHDGHYGKVPIDRAVVRASSTFQRTTVSEAVFELPSISARGSGSFGFGERAPLQFTAHAQSDDVGALIVRISGNKLPISGALESEIRVGGTLQHPSISGGFDIEHGVAGGVAIPRALGAFDVNGRDLVLRDAEVVFDRGTLYLAGGVPFTVQPFALGPSAAPLTLEAAAKGIDLANFTPLLPRGSKLSGSLEGRVALGGTAGAPRLVGQLAVNGGRYSAPQEIVPLSGIRGTLSFSGNDIRLDELHAEAGGGTLDGSGHATVPNLVRPGADATYAFEGRAVRARLDLPAYGRGTIDGRFALDHIPGQLARLSGTVGLQDAVIPFSALYSTAAAGAGDALVSGPGALPASPFDLAFDFNASAGRNVRVRSPIIDIGARGNVAVGGTLSAPQLRGELDSTGGTIAYVNTVFRVEQGAVSFEPVRGAVPLLNAVASTRVINPASLDGTDVTLRVSGPATSPTIELEAPPYDREQILALLLNVPAVAGAGQGIAGQQAFAVLNAQFTRNLLAPVEQAFGGALGLSNLNVTVDYGGNVGFKARKLLGKRLNATYGTSFSYPYRQTLSFDLRYSQSTVARLTFFESLGSQTLLGERSYFYGPTNPATCPENGVAGFCFSLQRLF